MALNWVMLPDPTTSTTTTKSDFTPLPNERTFFRSSHRTSLSLTTSKSTYPAHSPNISITSSDGTLYLTNQRIVYLPRSDSTISSNVASFRSFSCPLLNLHDTHLVMPWFGPNAWTALVQPVAGGGLPSSSAAIELKFTFKEGGAPDFQGKFEAIKERLQQVVDAARESNAARRQGANGVNMADVHLDELPSYHDSGHDRIASDDQSGGVVEDAVTAPAPANATADQVRAMAAAAAMQREQQSRCRTSRAEEAEQQMANETPVGAPPGYEEAQQQSVQAELERRVEQEQQQRQD